METHLKIVGILLVILSVIHIIFPRYFKWKEDLMGMSLINRQMMKTHTFFIALTVLLMGLLCLTSASELIETSLGHKIIIGFSIFWIIRLFFQLMVYSSKLWRGKRFETSMHIIFSCLWLYFCTVFIIIYLTF